MCPGAVAKKSRTFDPEALLATVGEGRRAMRFPKKQTLFAQGDAADAVFYLQSGKVKLAVVSKTGKEATIGILSERSLFGEDSLAGQALRMGTATAMTDCSVMRIEKKAMPFTGKRHFQTFSWPICWRVISGMKRVWLTNCSIPVKSGWRVSYAGAFWQGGSSRDRGPQNQSGIPGGNGRYHPFPGQLFYEPVHEIRLY
jgi:hypothetical protein